jgi:hypothetical protein
MRGKHGGGADEQPVEKNCRREAGNAVFLFAVAGLPEPAGRR